jgi:hypothetical protein
VADTAKLPCSRKCRLVNETRSESSAQALVITTWPQLKFSPHTGQGAKQFASNGRR